MSAGTINLSPKQHEAIKRILDWHKSDVPYFVLGGYAGSGKSTLSTRIAEKLGGVYCAYTAKAANVLMEKGIAACTIHSLIYDYQGHDPQTKELIWSLKSGEGKFLIVDEYSMIDQKVLDDLKLAYKKILFLGDPMQLPPIKEKKQILVPDFFLDEIHRQAADNPILQWAHKIRNGNVPRTPINDRDMFIVKSKNDLTDDELREADQIICGKNKTVYDINQYMRELYGYSDSSNLPLRGEKLVTLQNNHAEGIVNGRTFINDRNARDWNRERGFYLLDIGGKEYQIWDGDILGKDAKEYSYYSRFERVNYAYAITCHKAQGSEYDSIVIINEGWGETYINWVYTAVTRGKKKVILAY